MLLKDKKITILGVVEGQDRWGNPTTEKSPIEGGSNIWAYVRQLSQREIQGARTIDSEEELLFIINWRDDITAENWIEFKGEEYDIVRVDPYEYNKEDLKIYAKVRI